MLSGILQRVYRLGFRGAPGGTCPYEEGRTRRPARWFAAVTRLRRFGARRSGIQFRVMTDASDTRRRRRPGRRLRVLEDSPRFADSFGLVLLLLVVSFFVIAAGGDGNPGRIVSMVIFATTTWLALRASQVKRRFLRLALALIPLVTLVAIVLVLVGNDDTAQLVNKVLTILLVVVAPVAILRRLVEHPVISLNTFYGAVCVYMLIAMFFATAYGLIALVSGHQFFAQLTDVVPKDTPADRLPLLQLRDHHDHRLRRPDRRDERRAHDGRDGGHLRPALPDHRRRPRGPEPGPEVSRMGRKMEEQLQEHAGSRPRSDASGRPRRERPLGRLRRSGRRVPRPREGARRSRAPRARRASPPRPGAAPAPPATGTAPAPR